MFTKWSALLGVRGRWYHRWKEGEVSTAHQFFAISYLQTIINFFPFLVYTSGKQPTTTSYTRSVKLLHASGSIQLTVFYSLLFCTYIRRSSLSRAPTWATWSTALASFAARAGRPWTLQRSACIWRLSKRVRWGVLTVHHIDFWKKRWRKLWNEIMCLT